LRDQAARDQAGDDQAALVPSPAGALPADGALSPPGSAPSPAPRSPQSPLPSQSDRDAFPPSPPALAPATPGPAAGAILAPAAAAVPTPHPQPRPEGNASGRAAAPPCDAGPAGRPSPPGAEPAPAWLGVRSGSRAAAPLAVAAPARLPAAQRDLDRHAGRRPLRPGAGEGFFRNGYPRAEVPARHVRAGHTADPAWLHGPGPVGWNANSAPGRRGLRAPSSLRYRI
jgi:hypothetical protein